MNLSDISYACPALSNLRGTVLDDLALAGEEGGFSTLKRAARHIFSPCKKPGVAQRTKKRLARNMLVRTAFLT